MPTITFEASVHGPAVTVSEPEGGRLIDICDDAGAPVPFSCRSASCGTCLLEVLEGGALLDPPGPDEQALLELLEEPSAASLLPRRLACVTHVRGGAGHITLLTAHDGEL